MYIVCDNIELLYQQMKASMLSLTDAFIHRARSAAVLPTRHNRKATKILKMRRLVLLLAAASSAANVKKQLPPKISYCSAETTTGYPWPITDVATTEAPTTEPWPEETTTTEDYTTTTASGAGCPLGWIDDGKLGCFLFAPQMAGLSWIEALEYCEEQVCTSSEAPLWITYLQDGFLAEPKTEEQLNFLTSLAYVEEMATGVQGWWVGLADLGHEGEWVWQVCCKILSLGLKFHDCWGTKLMAGH